MKRTILLLTMSAIVFILAGCGGNDPLKTSIDPGHTTTTTTHHANN
jgi:predicted small lipoprotein YifL